jgi:hypothetical protein
MLAEAERRAAPLVTRDALLAVFSEVRATTRLARLTLAVAILALFCSAAGIVIMLVGP